MYMNVEQLHHLVKLWVFSVTGDWYNPGISLMVLVGTEVSIGLSETPHGVTVCLGRST